GSITTFQNNVDDMIDVLRTSSASEAPGYPNFVGWKTVNGKRESTRVSAWRLGPGGMNAEESRRIAFHIRFNRASSLFARCYVFYDDMNKKLFGAGA
ncbi:DUF2813 domain-containing protein, partial [Klebsiella pneumoniae]|uniref:DUF2813 domain-containing protein n=1 Tax=Klebsiella pneumoniae TaxID=573 RepID=UPI002108EBD6